MSACFKCPAFLESKFRDTLQGDTPEASVKKTPLCRVVQTFPPSPVAQWVFAFRADFERFHSCQTYTFASLNTQRGYPGSSSNFAFVPISSAVACVNADRKPWRRAGRKPRRSWIYSWHPVQGGRIRHLCPPVLRGRAVHNNMHDWAEIRRRVLVEGLSK